MTSTFGVLVSPQFMLPNAEFHTMLFNQVLNQVLLLVIIDKVHLHVYQDATFLSNIFQLKNIFSLKAYRNINITMLP